MRPRPLRPLETGLIAYVVVLALLLALTFGVNALVAAQLPRTQSPRAASPPNTPLLLPTLAPWSPASP